MPSRGYNDAMLNRIMFALSLLLAAPLAAQTATPAPAAAKDVVKVSLDTSAGRIVLALDKAHAPVTTANFLKYVDGGRFNGESFYRAMNFPGGGGLIQAGITSDGRKLYPAIAHEPVSQTGIKLSRARSPWRPSLRERQRLISSS